MDANTYFGSEFAHVRRDLSHDTADIRREQAMDTADIRRDTATGFGVLGTEVAQGLDNVNSDVKTSAWAVREAVNIGDNHQTSLQAAYFIAQTQKQADILAAIKEGAAAGILESAKNASSVTASVIAEGSATRALINSQLVDQLNRKLIEQNQRLVEAKEEGRFNTLYAQIAAVNSQVNNAKEQLVNFGTMAAGAGTQTSTSNNVK
jgi:hypothetical protein